MLRYKANLKNQARQLRKNMTDSERALWSRLRGKQLAGVQFYRQKPIGSYIVDFYAPKANLVVEVDGSQLLHDVKLTRTDVETSIYAGLASECCASTAERYWKKLMEWLRPSISR